MCFGVAVLCAVIVSACTAQSLPETAAIPKVDVRLGVSQSTYKMGEPIQVTAFVRNAGAEPFYVWKGMAFGFHGEGIVVLRLVDSAGRDVLEKYRVGGHRYECAQSDFGECVAKEWLLLASGEFYGITENRFSDSLQPGTYSLTVEYRSSAFPWLFNGKTTMEELEKSSRKLKYPAVLGTFHSNAVSFTVVR
jgi:hypothetical protein